MKNSINITSKIFLAATVIALLITIYIGSFSVNISSFYWNTFLINITFMGDAFFAFGVVLFLMFFFNKKKQAFTLFISLIISLVFIQIIKNVNSGLAVQIFFENNSNKFSIGSFLNTNSISSHTAIAFTLASFFVLCTKSFIKKILFLFWAIAVAFSRVLLVEDSFLTIVFGLIPAAIATLYLYKMKHHKKYSNKGYFLKERKQKINNSYKDQQIFSV